MIKRAISIVTYNRAKQIEQVLQSIMTTMPKDCNLFLCDDNSTDNTIELASKFPVTIIKGKKNKGVASNKNKALFAMQDCHFMAIIEDDLVAKEPGWFEMYEQAAIATDIHHFCRVQDKEIPETIPSFSTQLQNNYNLTPIFAKSPRGDFTFITKKVINLVGGLNPAFIGAGYAHGEWSERIAKAGLIDHPLPWIDIKEARNKFYQIGDTEGGRWDLSKEELDKQLNYNRKIARKLSATDYLYCPLVLE